MLPAAMNPCGSGQAPFPPVGEQLVADRAISDPRPVPEEPNDRRQEPEGRLGAVELPVRDRSRIGAEPRGQPALEQAQVQPPLTKVIYLP
jgi:hypothetical protein